MLHTKTVRRCSGVNSSDAIDTQEAIEGGISALRLKYVNYYTVHKLNNCIFNPDIIPTTTTFSEQLQQEQKSITASYTTGEEARVLLRAMLALKSSVRHMCLIK
jgi:predicted aldo/keto reductase-like oxidoreductase